MRSWRLSAQAEHTLTEIAEWTARQFGRQHAIAYQDALIDRIDRLAAGALPRGQSCAVLFQDEPDEQALADLRYYREGSHYLVFRETAEALVVVDILHVRMDLGRHLRSLAGRDHESGERR